MKSVSNDAIPVIDATELAADLEARRGDLVQQAAWRALWSFGYGWDEAVLAYHRLYETTPVTCKYLVVVAKVLPGDAFILTAYFTSRLKRGQIIWQP